MDQRCVTRLTLMQDSLLRQLDSDRARRNNNETIVTPPDEALSPRNRRTSDNNGGNGNGNDGYMSDDSSSDDDIDDLDEVGWTINNALTRLRRADTMVVERTFRWVDSNCNGLLDYEVRDAPPTYQTCTHCCFCCNWACVVAPLFLFTAI